MHDFWCKDKHKKSTDLVTSDTFWWNVRSSQLIHKQYIQMHNQHVCSIMPVCIFKFDEVCVFEVCNTYSSKIDHYSMFEKNDLAVSE